ncbi:MAG TPA: ABC transporter permease [Chitinophagales bacterium]|nr:ABC transporter permease [Chitinophagales bacterium]
MSSDAGNEHWSEVISTKRGLLDLRLGELWRYRDLVAMFVKRDFASSYKQTVLGPLWFFISPFMTVIMYTFVFSTIAGIKTDNIPAPLFYLTGTTLWNYFNQCFISSSGTFINNAGIFGKVYFPRLVSPISTIISNLIKFFIQLGVLVVIICYYVWFRGFEIHVSAYVLLFPLLVILMAGIAFGVGVITSALTTKYRDLQLFVNYGVAMLMYATPVIYPISEVPAQFKPYLLLNPLSPVIETFRFSIFGVGSFSWGSLGYSTLFMMVVVFIGIIIFNQVEKTFMDTV